MREDFIYLAGLIDGEGSILLSRKSPNEHRAPVVSVSSTTPEIVNWLKQTFGGSVSKHKTYKEHYKPSYSWKLTKKSDVSRLLNGVVVHLKEPRKVARVVHILNGYNVVTNRNGKYTPDQLQRKLDFEESFFQL